MARTHKLKKLYLQGAFFTLLGLSSSQLLADINITADFTPDPTTPHNNVFINTTRAGGYCANPSYTQLCKDQNLSSVSIPMTLQTSTPILAEHTDPRQGALLKVPSQWIDLEVRSPSGNPQNLRLKIGGIGATYRFPTAPALSHQQLWHGGSWIYAPTPCTSTGVTNGNSLQYQFFWKTPAANSTCGKRARDTIPSMSMNGMNIAYQLTTPNPLEMESGIYTGSHTYSVGPGSDFDFGDNFTSSTSQLTFNFALTVNHILQVRFPPGADRLTLIPAGGWQQWLIRGRLPEKLTAEQNFQFWTSTAFKMQLRCQYEVGDQCGIENAAGDRVPVETRVTLPAGLLNQSLQPTNRDRLSTDPSLFIPRQYVDNGRSTLHFEVDRDSVEQMTQHAGSRYSGNVTVLWDSQL